jgi:hypothetical protein
MNLNIFLKACWEPMVMPKKYDVMLPKGWKQEALHGSALSRRIHPRVSATHQLMGAYLSKGLELTPW